MSRLHDALRTLSPRDFSEVPLAELDTFLRDVFTEAELVINSVPPPPGGDPYPSASRTRTEPNAASNASEMTLSNVRSPPPDSEIAALQKTWGKPYNLGKKDNPLGVSVWKTAGHDRHGAWFARRSIHEGLGFTKWKKAMEREFPTSMAVEEGPGSGSVRGIGTDRRVERKVVDGVGKMEVYQLSAQFPGPVAPREFITMLLTSDSALGDASSVATNSKDSKKIIPRHYMVVSIPVDHPDAPPRQNLVRGKYESIEMIREIPLTPSKSKSTPNLLNATDKEVEGRKRSSTDATSNGVHNSSSGEDDPETNPVEWIMITRSDPGGGIPRFMVERGTPGSITADTVKFLDWACALTPEDLDADDEAGATLKHPDHKEKAERRESYTAAQANGHLAGIRSSSADKAAKHGTYEPSAPNEKGIISSLNDVVGSGIAAYVPETIQESLPAFVPNANLEAEDDSTDSSSVTSFASAEQYNTAEEKPHDPDAPPSPSSFERINKRASTSSLSIAASGINPSTTDLSKHLEHHDRELQKLDKKKQDFDKKLAKSREKDAKKIEEASKKSEAEAEKARKRHERDLRKHEDSHAKEIRKLQERREKEERKLEEKKQKAAAKDELLKAQRERDEAKTVADHLQKENEILKTQIGELQRENTVLVQKIGKTPEGQQALRAVRDEVGSLRRRGTSMGASSAKSVGSERSKASEAERGRGKDRSDDSEEVTAVQA